MRQPMFIRQSTITELETALPLLERFFREEGFRTPLNQIRVQLAEMLSNPDSVVFLAWLNSTAIGVATVTLSQGIEFGISAELEDLYVLPDARGTGVASALIHAVEEWCRARACTVIAVVVTPEGEAGHNLINYYRARGFQESGRTILYNYLDSAIE
jgi:aminoglycoside 6'-N-acetyltransferase I